MEHVGQLPCSGCDISLYGVSQSIHTCGSCKSLWHRTHHLRIHKCNNRNILRINTYHFAVLLYIGNNVVDRYLSRCSCGGWYCKYRYGFVFGRCNTLKTSDICEFRVGNNYSDTLSCVHGRTATYCDNVVSTGCLESLHALLNILYCWVWLDV